MLRDSALKLIRALEIEGGCNVQFALDPNSFDYYLIEVNPRVSRSSALASKASGYPIARVSAKIAVGMNLDEIMLANTPACFEPALDYVVTKMPRFPFDKFTLASNVSSIGKSAFQNCSALKTITIKTKLLIDKKKGKVGTNAFKGISSNAKVTVPKGTKKDDQKLLQKRGMPKKAEFKEK